MGRTTHHISAERSRENRDWARADIGTPSMTCIARIAGQSLYPHLLYILQVGFEVRS